MSVLPNPSVTTSYESIPIFDENTLPAGLRCEHRTKTDVWGVIRIFDGRVRNRVLDPAFETILEPDRPGLILPEQPHLVELIGAVRMQVGFYHATSDLPG